MTQFEKPEKNETVAVIKTSKGDISIRLFENKAPKTVENFTRLAREGYYDGQIFHRVIDNFMIQGGDPTGTGRGGTSIWKKPFEDEFSSLRNYRGALSMANSGPNTNGSQFFIVQMKEYDDNTAEYLKLGSMPEEVKKNYFKYGGAFWLDGKHTVFGQVYEGMDTVDAIAAEPTDRNDRPKEDIVIERIEIGEA